MLFRSADSSHQPGATAQGEPTGPQVMAQKQRDNKPLVLGSTILGALRTRAAWLEAREMLRAGTDLTRRRSTIRTP